MTWDLVKVLRATSYGQAKLDHAKKLVEDIEAEIRREKRLCVVCYYGSRVGGSMCTAAQCAMCTEEIHFGNTCVDVLCHKCAYQCRLCKHCGGDLELKNRRKL